MSVIFCDFKRVIQKIKWDIIFASSIFCDIKEVAKKTPKKRASLKLPDIYGI